ncbi:FG-GAP repeat domain-containing protein [Tautonia plasticadhaerens]|uniref:FG-GAP repeat protein n=1 Tax=Tautonia plasticadhaerens TaxID=2527974 RepID=A0A518GWW6_9BACT|nr:VCBS repeat-containing protein [Tautonia plasticadhaerens]QDV33089.1 FG-GAP repeat protein [Tautonia plasticadhaerens]
MMSPILASLVLWAVPPTGPPREGDPAPWERHAIDASSRGADGVRLADLDGDGLPDLATAWEEGGEIRACFNPGPDRSKSPWPSVAVGRVPSPEDAVIVDLDGDDAPDLVSCAEGEARTVSVHWNPGGAGRVLDPDAWASAPIPATVGLQMWMWCAPMQVDGRHGVDLALGGKGAGASIGWLEAPADPRDLDDWRWHPIRSAGWVMSILPVDLDEDGDLDLLCSDRKGPRRGVFWLERRDGDAGPSWAERPVGGSDAEVMFLDLADLDGDGTAEILVAAPDRGILIYRRSPDGWDETVLPLGPEAGTGKSVAAGDLDGDGRPELVVSTEDASGKHGVFSLARAGPGPEAPWSLRPISGTREGTKFDLVRLIDLDGDGDLDALTCEERDDLGVVWYENPGR